MPKETPEHDQSPSDLIDARIASLGDWRGEMLTQIRAMIHEAAPDVVEQVKWRKPTNPSGVPVWEHDGILCTGETYKDKVKITFARGAALEDPAGLFNASLNGNLRRAIDIHEGDKLNKAAFKKLIRAAVKLNNAGKSTKKTQPKATGGKQPKLLSGGNPQIPKGDGDAPVQAYIAAMPGWKRDAGRALDALIMRTAPKARKAVRWNSPFYGMADNGWFLSFHCFAKYIKVTFLNGDSLDPLPPVSSKVAGTRYFHLHEGETLDEKQFTRWLKQASGLPGEKLF
jgi:hypothetical protein